MEKAVKPEEPLFYIGLLIVICYSIYLFYMDSKQKVNKQHRIQSLKNTLLETEKKHQNSKALLRSELTKHYSSNWIDDALNGYIFENMPLILLKVAMGTPDDIIFNGNKGQVWKYNASEGSNLVINIWDEHVTTWHKTN